MAAKRQSDLFHALADPTRLALFERLARGEASVTVLTKGLEVSQPAVSQHLAALRRCGLVSHRREGRSMVYRARPEGLQPLTDWLEHYRRFWPERIERLRSVLKNKGESA